MVEDKELKRGINLPIAIFIIIGMVIGAGIWVSPAAYLSRTGPGIFIAYLIAVIPAVFVAFLIAYIGSAFPVSGGTYVITSRLLGGFGGFMTVWLVILAVGATIAFLAATLGVFIGQALGIPPESELLFVLIVGISVLVIFYFLNWIKVEISGLIELILTIVGDILVMVIFIIAAIPHFNPSNFEPMFPMGLEPVMFAALTFFFSYTGFTLILDVAGEVKNPKKNIPRAILISMLVLTILYVLQALMVAGVHPWGVPVGTVTEILILGGILPPEMIMVMIVLISIAIASTIHPSYMAYSRDILVAAREQMLPKVFTKVNKKHKTPRPALTLLLVAGIFLFVTVIPLLAPSYGIETAGVLLSAVTATVVLIIQVPISLAVFILPKKFPEWHEKAGFKPAAWLLKTIGILGSVSSLIFVLLLFTDPDAGIIIALIIFPFSAVGAIVYLFRRKTLAKRGIDIKEMMKTLPESVPGKVERLAKEK
jgi:APA family basic amino acid/polyamine antiporter